MEGESSKDVVSIPQRDLDGFQESRNDGGGESDEASFNPSKGFRWISGYLSWHTAIKILVSIPQRDLDGFQEEAIFSG